MFQIHQFSSVEQNNWIKQIEGKSQAPFYQKSVWQYEHGLPNLKKYILPLDMQYGFLLLSFIIKTNLLMNKDFFFVLEGNIKHNIL